MSHKVIDPSHDMILRVGGDDLLVSSKILSLASPVFEAMLKPHFKEGLEHHSGLGREHAIPLPDDDLAATTLFCQVAHFRHGDIPRVASSECLEELAVFCNKYMCAGAMVGYGTLWLQRQGDCQSLEDLSRLLLFAYVLELPDFFASISREMLQRQDGWFTSLWALSKHPIIDGDILGQFNKRRSTLHQCLRRAIMKPISRMARFNCDGAMDSNGKYLHRLKMCGMLPDENSADDQSFRTIANRASKFQPCRSKVCGWKRCGCASLAGMDMQAELQKGIENCLQSELGLCIYCVKTNERRLIEGQGKCSHSYLPL